MQFIFSPVLGALSDKFGRRPVILLSCLGLGFDYILMALAPDLAWLFVGRLISGITAASFGTAGAYIADVTPPEKRAAGFGMIGAAWGLGFVLGPALGGILGGVDPRLPFWCAACLAFVGFAYGFFVLPESLPPETREEFSWKRANPVGSLVLLKSKPELLGLAGVNFLFMLAHQAFPSVFVLYTGYRYGWTPMTMGLTLAGVGVCNVIVQGALVRPIVQKLGERLTLLTGTAVASAGFCFYGWAPEGWIVWVGVPVCAFMGLFGPAAQAIMTRLVPAQEQGQLQGANSSIMGITGIVGPGIFTLSFAAAIGPFKEFGLPGAPMYIAGLLVALGFVVALAVTARADKPESA